MDAFDYKEEKTKGRIAVSSDLVWNILTIVALVAIGCIVIYTIMIFLNPNSSLNPFPPKRFAIPTYPTSTPIIPTVTSTKAPMLPPTWTPEPSDTPIPTNTPRPTSTPFVTDTLPPSAKNPEPSLTPGGMSYVIQGEPQFIQDFADRGCQWTGVAGQVFDIKGSPVTGLIVQLGGSLNGKFFETQTFLTGLAPQYGPSGYEFTIADGPIASDQDLWVQLVDQTGLPLSNKIYFSTVDDCTKNLVLLSFKQAK